MPHAVLEYRLGERLFRYRPSVTVGMLKQRDESEDDGQSRHRGWGGPD
jgi:hypothetical protein